MGQFLFVEWACPDLQLLDAFAEMLVQGRPDYAWDPARATVRYADVAPVAAEALERGAREHVVLPASLIDERSAAPA